MTLVDWFVDFVILCLAVVVSHLEVGRCLLKQQLENSKGADKKVEDKVENKREEMHKDDAEYRKQLKSNASSSIFYQQLALIVEGVKSSLKTLVVRILIAVLLSTMILLEWTANKIKRTLHV